MSSVYLQEGCSAKHEYLHSTHCLNTFPPLDYQTKSFSDTTLVVRDLSCERGYQTLFDGLDFRVSSGQAMQISGANGVGKTSLLRIVATLGLAVSGEVLWNDSNIRTCLAEYRAAIAWLGHKQGLKADLTPAENLHFSASVDGVSRVNQDRIDSSLDFFGIGLQQDRATRQLSAGQQQRVALSRLLVSDAPIWILDEPATALDKEAISKLTELMQRHLSRNGMILFTSHQDFAIAPEQLSQFRIVRDDHV